MTNEEKIIQEKLGNQNPFRVPEGYFDSFADQLMSQIPETKREVEQPVHKATKVRLLRPIMVAAACACIAIFSITLYLNHAQEPAKELTATKATPSNLQNAEEEYLDDAADYVMLDNADIYACLSE